MVLVDHLSERWETETDVRVFKLPSPFYYNVRGILFSQAAAYADNFRIIDFKIRMDVTTIPHKNVLFEKDLNQTHPIFIWFDPAIRAKYLSMGFGNTGVNKACNIVLYYEVVKGDRASNIFDFVKNYQK